jgi:hypothetical protein
MLPFLHGHLPYNGARAFIGRRKLLEVARQVLLYLALRFGKEGEIPAVAQDAGGNAHRQRARVPNWIQEARAPAQFMDALSAPREVVLLLGRSFFKRTPVPRIPGRERLPLIKGLGANFANVIYPHQRRSMVAFAL